MAQKLDLREGTGGTALGDTAARLLYLAACGSKSEVIHALKDHGVSIDERTSRGCTALILAANKGRLSAVEVLLRAGANVNSTTCGPQHGDENATALHCAAGEPLSKSQRKKLVKLAQKQCLTVLHLST